MVIKDRFTIGFIAGVLGGVVMSILDYISLALGISEMLFIDWAAVFIFANRTDAFGELIVAQVGQLLFSGFTGILFAYLIIGVTSKYLYFKGVVHALLVWFFSYAIVVLFEVTPLTPVRLDTILSNIVSVIIYGLVLAVVHKKLYFSAGDHIQELQEKD